jgi:hypothetical protein
VSALVLWVGPRRPCDVPTSAGGCCDADALSICDAPGEDAHCDRAVCATHRIVVRLGVHACSYAHEVMLRALACGEGTA